MNLSRETRALLGVLAAVVLLVIVYDVFFPPPPPAAGTAPAVELMPEGRRGLDKTPLLYAEEYVRDLASRVAPALVMLEGDDGTRSTGFVVGDDGEIVVALDIGRPPWRVVSGRARDYEATLVALDEWSGIALLRADLTRPVPTLEIVPARDTPAASTLIGLQLVDGVPAVRSLVAPGQPSVLESRLLGASLAPGEVVVDLDGRLVAFGAWTLVGTQPLLSEALVGIVAQLRDRADASLPWIGVHFQTIDDDLRGHFAAGALVAVHVERHSPGSDAGVSEGMSFASVRGGEEEVEIAEDVSRLVSRYDEIELVPAAPGRRPIAVAVGRRQWPPGLEPASGGYGLAAAAETGVAVAVASGSPAARHGVRSGDVVEAVNRQPVATPVELDRALARPGRHLLTVRRDGRWFYVPIAVETDAPAGAERP